jgi:small subunit ribosomal protein S1
MYRRLSRYVQYRRSIREPGEITLDRADARRAQDLRRVRVALERRQILTGRVTRVETYGVFIELGAVEGLIHVRELTAVLRIGQRVQVRVLRVAPNGTRIALSMRLAPPRDTFVIR